MFKWMKSKLTKGFWSSLAMLIVIVMAGPAIVIGMELMALVEVMGASTFVLAYLAGLKLYLEKPVKAMKKFESYGFFFVPTSKILKQMPSMAIHALPERTLVMTYLGSVLVCILLLSFELLH